MFDIFLTEFLYSIGVKLSHAYTSIEYIIWECIFLDFYYLCEDLITNILMTPLDQLHIDTVEKTEITVEKILGDRKNLQGDRKNL